MAEFSNLLIAKQESDARILDFLKLIKYYFKKFSHCVQKHFGHDFIFSGSVFFHPNTYVKKSLDNPVIVLILGEWTNLKLTLFDNRSCLLRSVSCH